MLERSGAPFVITHRGLKTRLPRHNVELVPLDDDERVLQGQRQDNPSVSVPADTIAYIIYTSGSTGQPKGVCGTHRASLNRFLWMSRTYPFARDEVTCQKTSLSFVDSIWEIFGPALNGVSVVIVPDETVTNLERFIRILAHHGITRIVLVPSYLRLLLDHCEDLQSIVPKLTWCVTSGEVLPPDLAQRFHQKLPRVRLLNLYGSSEVAGDVTYFEVTESDGTSSIPIGRPIANTHIYLLDCHQKPVPVGASGEIHVAGDSLGSGYWRDPELTAERFVPNPFSVEADARLFKTGDLGRYRTDGVIEYLGRADAQIKIRGVRIEPGEIESALKSHPLVRDAVVIASGHLGEDARLIAYVIRQDHRTPPSIELRHHVRTVLPEYMVPSAIFVIDSLPLLPNGKVDRLCMLRSGQPETASEAVLVEPRNSTEESLVQIWREVLSVSRVSIDDNFFELGGHSLLGIRVFSRIRKVFQVELPLKALFNQPTISGLALEIEKAHRNGMVLREPLVSNVSSRRNKAQLLAKLDKLSAEEIDDLLNKVIGGKGN